MGTKPRKPATPPEPSSPPNETELPERWSVRRKGELVLRLLRGEALDAVSRESEVPAHELESWKRIFLEQGTRGLKTRSDPEKRELTLARAKIGELMMRLELAEHLMEKRGSRTSGRSNGDETRPEPWDRPAVSADDDLCRLPGAALDGLPDDGTGARRATDRGQARAQDGAQ
jgi:hypothetical protein